LQRLTPSTRVFQQWHIWAILGVSLTTSVAGFAAAFLLRLPGLPNCPTIFLPTASASLRLYCAQVAADKRTIDDLLAAIALVEDLPDDHPMRMEIDHHLELWSVDILELAEESFQAGDLDKAIATARRIPAQTASADEVSEQIERWQSIWSKAEAIYKDAEDELRQQNFGQAFIVATQLLDVGNEYWAKTRHQELTGKITSARRDGAKLAEARSQARRGTADSILEAIKIAQEIPTSSYVYGEAQKAVRDFTQQMYYLAMDQLDRGDSSEAVAIATKIPTDGDDKLQEKVTDFLVLARASGRAGQGSQTDLEAAIQQVRQLTGQSPLYSKGQQLISRWELEIQGLTRLNWARRLAAPGTIGDLSAAISEARLISSTNPRWQEAEAEIERWTSQVETMEDRPYLNRAEQLATAGDVTSLQNAIAEARKIRPGRALHNQAQERIQTWSSRVQTIQDEPILAEARSQARSGNLQTAITTAERISSGRALHDDAQADIRRWRNQIQGQQSLQDAYRAASLGNVNGLADAIRLAGQVPTNSSSRSEADRMRDTWSRELLRIANMQAVTNIENAIATAERIPSGTAAYSSAQNLIQQLEAQLAPPPPVPDSTAPVELDTFEPEPPPVDPANAGF
jgi:hypothetical protein